MPNFNDVKNELRQLESDFSVVPAGFKKKIAKDKEQWEITFDKLMLYQFESKDPEKHVFEAEIKPNYDLHASIIENVLKSDFPNINLNVSVKPHFKTLPIPFFNIPIKIPFTDIGFRKAPNKVRGDDSLGTNPVEVKVTFTPTDDMNGRRIWDSLNKVACLHTKNAPEADGNIEVINFDISKRASKNPLRYLLMGLTWLCKNIFPKSIWQAMPHIKSNSPHPYGYHVAKQVLDPPLINSGVAAHMANAAVIGGAGACIAGALYTGVKECSNTSKSSSGFALGALAGSSDGLGINPLVGIALAGSHNSFASSYGNGLLFSSGANALCSVVNANSSEGCHAPFATRTKLLNK